METQQRILVVGACGALIVLIIELARRRHLRDEYSIPWLVAGVLMAVAAVTPALGLAWAARLLGLEQPPMLLLALAFLAVVALCLHFSVRLSLMTDRIKTLAQQLALLENEVNAGKPPEDGGEGSD